MVPTDSRAKSILEKIAKLRALAARATTQGEAEAAAAQAAALIAKYQIDEATVELGVEAPEEIAEGDVLWHGPKRNERWRSLLASGLAYDHGCAVMRIYGPISGTTYRIAGRPSDVSIVRYLFAWLHVEISRLAERESGRAAKNSFRFGATIGVLRAMETSREAILTGETGKSVALAVVDRSDLAMSLFEKEAKNSGHKIGTASSALPKADPSALRRGLIAGAALAPKPGLGGATPLPMLGSGK